MTVKTIDNGIRLRTLADDHHRLGKAIGFQRGLQQTFFSGGATLFGL